jgi:hypothetical protein
MVSQKIGLDVLLADVPIIVFDPESKQWWMRSAWQNYPRELACRVVWVLLGKI